MLRYSVRYELKPGVILHGPTDLDIGEHDNITRLRMRNIWDRDKVGNRYVSGIQFDTELNADSIEDAISASRTMIDTLATHMSLLTSVSLPTAQPLVAVDIDPEHTDHEYLQFIYPPLPPLSRGSILPPKMIDFVNHFENLGSREDRESIARALIHYRKGLRATDSLDGFLDFWIGLEALNRPLATKLNTQRRTLTPIKTFLESHIENGEELFSAAKNLRNDFVHGSANVQAMMSVAQELLSPLRFALLNAVLFLTGTPRTKGMSSDPIPWWDAIAVRLSTVLHKDGDSRLGIGEEPPCFDVVFEETEPVTDKKSGDTTLRISYRLYERLAPNVSHKEFAWKFLGRRIKLEGTEMKRG